MLSKHIELRDYQASMRAEALDLIAKGKSPLVQLATGGGKTPLIASIVREMAIDRIVWVVAHRQELVDQIAKNLDRFDVAHGCIKDGQASHQRLLPVQVATIQTLVHRHHSYADPDVLIFDEAHHVAANSWQRIITSYPKATRIGFTATPERLDGKGLDDSFTDIILGADHGASEQELIESGYLADYTMRVPKQSDLLAARKSAKEYTTKEKRQIVTPLIASVVDTWLEYAPLVDGAYRSTLAFCVDRQHARSVADAFCAKGVRAEYVDAETPKNEREDLLVRFAAGEIDVLANVELFTEGLDVEGIRCVILARPCKSKALARQMLGRGLRPKEGGGDCLFLDHAGIHDDHGAPTEHMDWRLEGGAHQRWIAARIAAGERGSVDERVVQEVPGDLIVLQNRMEGMSGHQITRAMGVSSSQAIAWARAGAPQLPDGSWDPTSLCAWLQSYACDARLIGNERFLSFMRDNGYPMDDWTAFSKMVVDLKISHQAARSKLKSAGIKTEKMAHIDYWREVLRKVGFGPNIERSMGLAVSKKDAAAALGMTKGALEKALKNGLPTTEYGNIVVERAQKWMAHNPHKCMTRTKPSESFDIKVGEAAQSLGVSTHILKSVFREFGVVKKGWVDSAKMNRLVAADAEIKSRLRSAQKRSKWLRGKAVRENLPGEEGDGNE